MGEAKGLGVSVNQLRTKKMIYGIGTVKFLNYGLSVIRREF